MAPPPPVTEEEDDEVEERPWPPRMKMKLAPYAMYCVFSGAGPRGHMLGCAYAGLHCALQFARFLSLSPVAEVAALWGPVLRVLQCLCYTATALIMWVFIRHHMNVDGVYVVEFDPPPQLAAPATTTVVEQLPPPPPEMDMC
ncbi:hypothetical protein SEVIR_9G246301v4 [Setaria viridis]|uniref:Uncharacterized protein n=1 Tax=Setaria viridis TaxID=4556 RepID=A0A4U6SZY4_SETVI|nr:hypothetical protein SEVIR_9G246301v2 [Setaria viridis]